MSATEFAKSATSDVLPALAQPPTASHALPTKSFTTEDAGPTVPLSAMLRME